MKIPIKSLFIPYPKDLRLKILHHLEFETKSTEEYVLNEWLSKQHSDLGTIKRALIELVQSDFIRISNFKTNEDAILKLTGEIDTTTNRTFSLEQRNAKKSSKRLLSNMGDSNKIYPKVFDIKMYATLKGLIFYHEHRRFKSERKFQFLVLIVGFVLGLISSWFLKS